MKISFHKFPEDEDLFRKLIVAIRRDVGKDFKVIDHTRVCSRHHDSTERNVRNLTTFQSNLSGNYFKQLYLEALEDWKMKTNNQTRHGVKQVELNILHACVLLIQNEAKSKNVCQNLTEESLEFFLRVLVDSAASLVYLKRRPLGTNQHHEKQIQL